MKAYFFDLDGTLTDSRKGLYPAFRAGLEAVGVNGASDDKLATFLGTPLPEMFRSYRPDVSRAEIDAGIQAFRAVYEITGIVANEMYPGVRDMLTRIRERGAKIQIVTSKPEFQAVRVVAHLGLDNLVDHVIGAGLAENDTKTELVARALAASDVAGSEAVMVGDRHYDMIGALENGVCAVGVTWGYGSRDELVAARADYLVDSPKEFCTLFVDEAEGPATHAVGSRKSTRAAVV